MIEFIKKTARSLVFKSDLNPSKASFDWRATFKIIDNKAVIVEQLLRLGKIPKAFKDFESEVENFKSFVGKKAELVERFREKVKSFKNFASQDLNKARERFENCVEKLKKIEESFNKIVVEVLENSYKAGVAFIGYESLSRILHHFLDSRGEMNPQAVIEMSKDFNINPESLYSVLRAVRDAKLALGIRKFDNPVKDCEILFLRKFLSSVSGGDKESFDFKKIIKKEREKVRKYLSEFRDEITKLKESLEEKLSNETESECSNTFVESLNGFVKSFDEFCQDVNRLSESFFEKFVAFLYKNKLLTEAEKNELILELNPKDFTKQESKRVQEKESVSLNNKTVQVKKAEQIAEQRKETQKIWKARSLVR